VNVLNNGMLAVATSGRDRTEHIFQIRASETLCGAKPSRNGDLRDFPMAPSKACAACIVELANAAIGNQSIAPPEPTEGTAE
jgi:hypothetical protein